MKSQFLMKKYALVVANGKSPSPMFLKKLADESDLIVAADGGGNILASHSLVPDVLLGDMDSIEPKARTKFERERVTIISYGSQEENDLEKSIRYLIGQGHKNIVLTAVQGNRDDHNFAALEILKKYKNQATIYIVTDYFEIFLLQPGTHNILTEKNAIFSIFGFSRGYNIETENLKYPLKQENLFEGSRGVSNLSLADNVTISFTRGNLLIFRSLRKNGTD